MCVSCANWFSFASQRKRRSKLPLDQFIDYVLHPAQQIDERLRRRLFTVVTRGCVYGPRLPPQVQIIVRESAGNADAVCAAWWDYNGRPAIVSDSALARVLRRYMRA